MSFQEQNKIKGIPVIQNKQEFLIAVFKIEQIFKFTRYTHRLIVNFNEDDSPEYNGKIQRKIENSRVEKIADFLINDPEAIFPTNVVFNIPIQVIKAQESKNDYVELELEEKVFTEINKDKDNSHTYITIIDGQHRIRGIEIAIERLKGHISALEKTGIDSETLSKKHSYYTSRLNDLLKIELVVSFFIDKTLEHQAMIFSTINRTQKRVSESLVYSLFGLTADDSPQKTALQIVYALNSNIKSPFYNRIKLYGGSYKRNQSPPLSQAGMVKSIINLISENPREAENDRYRKRKELNKRSLGSSKKLPFRKYYAVNQDTVISDLMYYFFSAVKDTFKDNHGKSYWDFADNELTNILHTTVGYQALLMIFIDILDELNEEERLIKNSYETLLKKANNLDFSDTSRYPFTSKSKNIFYLDMSLSIWSDIGEMDNRREQLNLLLKKLD